MANVAVYKDACRRLADNGVDLEKKARLMPQEGEWRSQGPRACAAQQSTAWAEQVSY